MTDVLLINIGQKALYYALYYGSKVWKDVGSRLCQD